MFVDAETPRNEGRRERWRPGRSFPLSEGLLGVKAQPCLKVMCADLCQSRCPEESAQLLRDRGRSDDVCIATDADESKVNEDSRKALTNYFHYALIKAVSDAFPVVDAPGPMVLRCL